MLMMASQSSLTTASSVGKWPRALVTFDPRQAGAGGRHVVAVLVVGERP